MIKGVFSGLGLLGIILIVSASGCTESQAVTYDVNGSTFQVPDGWKKIENELTKGKGGAEFWKGNDPRINIIMLDKAGYDSNYAEDAKSSGSYEIRKETINASGVEIKVLRVTDSRNGDVLDSFYFQKNGKYFRIYGIDYTTQAAARADIDKAVQTIASTLK